MEIPTYNDGDSLKKNHTCKTKQLFIGWYLQVLFDAMDTYLNNTQPATKREEKKQIDRMKKRFRKRRK